MYIRRRVETRMELCRILALIWRSYENLLFRTRTTRSCLLLRGFKIGLKTLSEISGKLML